MDRHTAKELHHATEKLAHRKSCWYGFLYGIALGLGASVGVSIVAATILYILQQLQLLPFVNDDIIQKIIGIFEDITPTWKE